MIPSSISRRNVFSSISTTLQRVHPHLPPLNFITLHYAYFIGTCFLASLVFWGSSTPPRSVTYTDSLFLVISAMTLAGLNTINLSILNVWQQIILFFLLMMGSAIFVSIAVVHVRVKAFERRFAGIVKEQKERSRSHGASRPRRLSFGRSSNRNGPPVDGVVVRGRPITAEKQSIDEPRQQTTDDLDAGPAVDDSQLLTPEDAATPRALPNSEQGNDSIGLIQDAHSPAPSPALQRHITFASLSSPTRLREHHRLFDMQGIGARPRLMNHPSMAERPVYTEDLPKIDEGVYKDNPLSLGFLHNGFIARNSQFSNLSSAERQRLGGVEYRAITMLSVIVPLYFVLWQLLACLGMGAYLAKHRKDTTVANGLNPWWVGAFLSVSAFNNSGMSLLDANMVAFQTTDYLLITTGLLILAGNTCYPIFLRFILWTMWKLLPSNEWYDDWKVTLRFLLDHPRRCYTNLFPSRHTWWLFAALIALNGIDWIAFEVLNIGNSTVESLPAGSRALDGLFQALAVRSGGFYVVAIPNLRIGLLVLYVLMMYISVYPVVITMRNSNVYEERSLGVYADDPQAKEQELESAEQSGEMSAMVDERNGFIGRLKRRVTNRASKPETRGYFVRQQLRSQLSHDLWWIVLAVLFITITETSSFERDPVSYSTFNILFEIVSAYGCVGISVGLPNVAYSFCGGWHVVSKLILCAVMLRGRHRGLPVAIDRAVLLPGEHLAAAEEEDAQIRFERSKTMEKDR